MMKKMTFLLIISFFSTGIFAMESCSEIVKRNHDIEGKSIILKGNETKKLFTGNKDFSFTLNRRPHSLFTLSDAERILGEKAHLEDSTVTVKEDACRYEYVYIADSKDQNTGKTGALYVIFEDYKQISSAEEVYTSIEKANKNHEGVRLLDNIGDEAYFHSDGANFYFILVRKGRRIFRMKVNKITSKTSLEAFDQIAAKIAGLL